MKIFIAHSSGFDFEKNLYFPIKKSNFYKKYRVILPLQDLGYRGVDRQLIKECDLLIAEISYPSTGQGIELGWGDIFGVPIVCIYKNGSKTSKSLKKITEKFISYKDQKDMIGKLEKEIEKRMSKMVG